MNDCLKRRGFSGIENAKASVHFRWVIQDRDKRLMTYDKASGPMKHPPQHVEPQLDNLNYDPKENEYLAEAKTREAFRCHRTTRVVLPMFFST
ncbi:hypothetical protein SAMN06265222_11957 [Neorhodopirellula lusitana]|uniref:Uncharacterized protein n=1 Tax=Neorhodopirellula lusitana TaxID=445327 RepID=A0ABY1QQ44_9BACT|nr:hypothetical protein SAMN06265222_11957 [Neorhodopirellula lusitana]